MSEFVTPIRPLERGESWCVFASRGTWEFMVHPADVAGLVRRGVVVDGQRLSVEVVDEWPYIRAVQIVAVDRAANEAFLEAAAA